MNVYITYFIQDQQMASQLCDDLDQHVQNVWLNPYADISKLHWQPIIDKRPPQYSVFIILLSKKAINHPGYILAQQQALQALQTDFSGEKYIFIPAILDHCQIPQQFLQVPCVDLSSSYEKGLYKIIQLLETNRLPDQPKDPFTYKQDSHTEANRIYISIAPNDYHNHWIQTMVNHLKMELKRRLWKEKSFSLCLSPESSNASMKGKDTIVEMIKSAVAFVIVLSPQYLNSARCHEERNLFMSKQNRTIGRILVVEFQPPGKPVPEEIQVQKWFRFGGHDFKSILCQFPGANYSNTKFATEYFDMISAISHELATIIRDFESNSQKQTATQNHGDFQTHQPTVFLAEVTEDLMKVRHKIYTYLKQAGFRIMPDQPLVGNHLSKYLSAINETMEKCQIFVQPLSSRQGKIFPDAPGIEVLQYQFALKQGKTIFQWRSPSIKPTTQITTEHQKLLFGTDVQVSCLEDFMEDIVTHIKRTMISGKLTQFGNKALVLIHANDVDRPIAHQLAAILKRENVTCLIPDWQASQFETLKSLEPFILNCDGIIIVYGHTDRQWVIRQVMYCQHLRYRRVHPLKAFAVFNGPPLEKPSFRFQIEGLKFIDCRNGDPEDIMAAFIKDLTKE